MCYGPIFFFKLLCHVPQRDLKRIGDNLHRNLKPTLHQPQTYLLPFLNLPCRNLNPPRKHLNLPYTNSKPHTDTGYCLLPGQSQTLSPTLALQEDSLLAPRAKLLGSVLVPKPRKDRKQNGNPNSGSNTPSLWIRPGVWARILRRWDR